MTLNDASPPEPFAEVDVYAYEGLDYRVVVQPSLHSPRSGAATYCYAVVNKRTGVTEAEAYQLPAALSHAMELQRHLNDIRIGRYQAAVSKEVDEQFERIFGKRH